MNNSQPPLNWLRSFVAAANTLSFTRAAADLSVTQAAVSKHIKGLESWLGIQLFIREAHGLALTEQGNRYYRSSAPLLAELERLTQQFSVKSTQQRLRIRSNISFSALRLPAALAQLKSGMPALEIEINNGIWQPERPSENADIEIGYCRHESLSRSKNIRALGQEQLFPVVSATLDSPDLASQPLIQVSGYSGDWHWWVKQQTPTSKNRSYNHWLNTQGLRPRVDIHTDNSLSAYTLCAQGMGIALARSHLAKPLLDSGQLVRLKGAKNTKAPDMFFARLSHRGAEHPAALALFDILIAQ